MQKYNKAIYGPIAAAVSKIIVSVLAGYGTELGLELEVALTTILTFAAVYFIPNKAE